MTRQGAWVKITISPTELQNNDDIEALIEAKLDEAREELRVRLLVTEPEGEQK